MLSLMLHPLFVALAADAATAPAPDPTLTIVASAFGGAALTGLITLVVNWQSGIRERKKWVLEARYGAYTEYLERIARDDSEMQSRVVEATQREGRHGLDLQKDFLGTQLLAKPALIKAIQEREKKYAALISALAKGILEIKSVPDGKTAAELADMVLENHRDLAREFSEATANVLEKDEEADS
jgi:hypothetical protein